MCTMDAFCGRMLALATLIIALFLVQTTQAQDNVPPVWDEDSVKVLTDGVSEDTPLGTVLGKLSCIDADGDDIYYAKVSGKALIVRLYGDIILAEQLDFEDKDNIGYNFKFSCYDVDINGLPIHNPVNIEVSFTLNDANDQPPEFNVESKDGYSFAVSEDDDIGFNLSPIIKITDLDRGFNAELSNVYIICNSPNITERNLQVETSKATCTKFDLFYVQKNEGKHEVTLKLKDTLDYETRAVYSSKLVAVDNALNTSRRLSTTINIQIKVADAQDVDPLFVNLGASAVVSEGASIGDSVEMVIAARDGDLGDQRPVKIVMVEDKLDAFSLDSSVESPIEEGVYTARLRVKNVLDRESIEGAYDFVVKVIELDKITGAETSATATATYSIIVSDINDESPNFDSLIYRVNVTEMEFTNEAVQLTGLRMVCNDLDEPRNAKYDVTIVSQSYPGVFAISPGVSFTGTAILFLTVQKSSFLDYDVEAYRRQTVQLKAQSITDPPLSNTTTVEITLIDINDNRPIFSQQSYVFSISESITTLPHSISTISAIDNDSGPNGNVTYRLEGGTSNKFAIKETTGELFLIGRVDYETTPLYVFLVYAQDQGQDSQVNQAQVTVDITNFNDIVPVFDQDSYQTSVNEDSLNFLIPVNIRARDNEEGTGAITYRILTGQTADNAFNLNRLTGSLTLFRQLRYGTNGIYKLEVEASDNGTPPLVATVQVTVNVIDQNDFKPVISPKIYRYTVSELVKPGVVVAEVKGIDKDQGEFGKITYRIDSGAFDNFIINPDSGVVTINNPQNFDFDVEKFYTVNIVGSDGGAPQLFDTATLEVKITDANNKKPEFDETIYTATVDEANPINYKILRVSATDKDSTKDLEYRIDRNSIFATNGAGNRLTNTITYNFKEAIGINPITGDIFIMNKLNKEEALGINFFVVVEDMNAETADQTASVPVAITVTGDVNTEIKFDPIEQSFVNEGSEKGYDITTVTARDPTSVIVVRNFELVSSSRFFEVIRTTGQIRLKNTIDYETDPSTHRILIRGIADDGKRSATTTVTIKINDDNDNAPEFDLPEYTATVDEDAPSFTKVANIHATDKDTASYGPVAYRIGGGLDSSNFVLYKATRGVDVLVARGVQLDYNTRNYYELDIVATDNPDRTFSNEQKNSNVKLKITVIDKNNHKPEFIEETSVRKMAVAETAEQGKSVGTILATDDDFGVNGDVTYYLQALAGEETSARGVQLFTIVPRAGIVTVATDSLLGNGGSKFRVQVFARDGGVPFQSNSMILEIEVLSTENNDGNPVWFSPANNYIFTVPEEKAGYVIDVSNIFSVVPRTGNKIQYVLSNLSTDAYKFGVDKDSGDITVRAKLDREEKDSYTLLIYAEDTSDPLKIRTGRQIIIRLQDENDNEPSFVRKYSVCKSSISTRQEISFYENVQKGASVYKVEACDADLNDPIYYFLYNETVDCKQYNEESAFTLEQDGNIVAKDDIDYEEGHTYVMCVIASSTSQNPFSNGKRKKRAAINIDITLENVAYIIFNIKDENDNRPEFPDTTASAVMVTDARDYPIIVFDASDKDGKGFNIPVYNILETKFYPDGKLVHENPGKLFVIKNNELHPDPPRGKTFQDYAKGRFELTVRATDPVNPAFYDTQIVTIYVHLRGQAMKVILNMPPTEGIALGMEIADGLDSANSLYNFHYLHVSVSNSKDGINKKKTDVCFVTIDSRSHNILSTFELVNLMSRSEYKNVLDESKYEIQDIGRCYPSTSSEDQMKWKDIWWVLVVLAIFVGFCALVFIVIIIFMHRRYRRYMETEKTYLVPQ